MIFSRLIIAVILICSLNGCVGWLVPPDCREAPKTKIVCKPPLTSDFLSCLAGSLKMTPEQRRREKEQAQKIFKENPDSKNRLLAACLAFVEDTSESSEYSLTLLREQQKLSPEADSRFDGLVEIVGRLLAYQKKTARQSEKLDEGRRKINSLRLKLEQLKKIEKLMSEREK